MDPKPTRRNYLHSKARKNKSRTNKILDRLTYSPKKHKQKITKKLRQKLQQKPVTSHPPTSNPPSKLKLGSMNVNGLDIETSWAVEQLLTTRDFDVSISYKKPLQIILSINSQILALSETLSRSDHPSTVESIDGYVSWTSERGGGDKGGGVSTCSTETPSQHTNGIPQCHLTSHISRMKGNGYS